MNLFCLTQPPETALGPSYNGSCQIQKGRTLRFTGNNKMIQRFQTLVQRINDCLQLRYILILNIRFLLEVATSAIKSHRYF